MASLFSKNTRRWLLMAAVMLWLPWCYAGGYPSRPIKMVVPFAPGGGTDIIARAVADRLGRKLGQAVIVVNVPGAGGTIGAATVARADPDGYTLLAWHIGMISSAFVFSPLPYDPLKAFTPIGELSSATNLLAVNAALPVHNLREFIDLAKSKPGALNFGSSGIGGADHLSGELLARVANIKVTHVPYKGGGPAAVAAAGGEVQFVTGTASQVLPLVKAGKLRGIVVMQKERNPSLPDVPSAPEAGLPQLDYKTWFGLWGPAGVPNDVVKVLSTALQEVLRAPDLKVQLEKIGVDPAPSSADEFSRMFREEYVKWNGILSDVLRK